MRVNLGELVFGGIPGVVLSRVIEVGERILAFNDPGNLLPETREEVYAAAIGATAGMTYVLIDNYLNSRSQRV